MNSHDTQFRGYQAGYDWNGNNMPYIRTAYDSSPLATVFDGYCLGQMEPGTKNALIGVGSGLVGLALGLLIMNLIMKRRRRTTIL